MNTMKALLITAACILLFSLPAEGASWVHVTSTANATFYVDIDGIDKAGKPVVKAWTKWVYNEPKFSEELNEHVSHISTYRAYNCESRKILDLDQFAYSRDARLIARNPEKESWVDVPPKTALHDLFEIICQF